jgi:hypothetical protein
MGKNLLFFNENVFMRIEYLINGFKCHGKSSDILLFEIQA